MWDLAKSTDSRALLERYAARGRPTGAVCHAPAIFRHVEDGQGAPLVKGRRVTGFSNGEEEGVGLTEVVPSLLEDMLKEKGADYEKGEDWAPHVVIDGKLVTGQNPASFEDVARKLLALLG